MKRIPSSEQMRQALNEFLSQGTESAEQPASRLLKLAAGLIIQEALEQEVSEVAMSAARRSRLGCAMATDRDAFAAPKVRSCCKCHRLLVEADGLAARQQ